MAPAPPSMWTLAPLSQSLFLIFKIVDNQDFEILMDMEAFSARVTGH